MWYSQPPYQTPYYPPQVIQPPNVDPMADFEKTYKFMKKVRRQWDLEKKGQEDDKKKKEEPKKASVFSKAEWFAILIASSPIIMVMYYVLIKTLLHNAGVEIIIK